MTFTIEQVSRFLTDKFGLFTTAAGIEKLVQNQKLRRVPCDPDDCRQSKAGWRVERDSVMTYLERKGFTYAEIVKVLF